MKHSNPGTMKPPLSKINADLNSYKCNTKSTKKYITTCKECGEEFEFYERDLKDKIYRCPKCGHEEIFFWTNFY